MPATTPEVLEYQVRELKDGFAKVQDSVEQIADAVGILKLIELRSQQQTAETEKLSQRLHTLHTVIQDIRQEVTMQSMETRKYAEDEIEKIATKVSTVDKFWNEKYNKFLGLAMGISLISGALSTLVMFNMNKALAKIEADHEYVLQLQTIDALPKLKRLPIPQSNQAATPAP